MTLYGPNWNGIYWEQNTTKGTDSLAAIIDSASPTATKTFKWIFIVSGNKEDQNFAPEKLGHSKTNKIFESARFYRRVDFFRGVDTSGESIPSDSRYFRGVDTFGELLISESRYFWGIDTFGKFIISKSR